ncbi:MAG: hypothetical protein HQM16_10680 [Deltaproteobacteria bacterium]|nr:hypothetical protein [Deltaproteobacteria bacterium]
MDQVTFKFTTNIYVTATTPTESNCRCKYGNVLSPWSSTGWSCRCDFTNSTSEYSFSMAPMGLSEDNAYDDENYQGIIDEKKYQFETNGIRDCSNSNYWYDFDYDTPKNITAQFRGSRIDFENEAEDLLWSADLHEDETFDFTIGGYPDTFNLPTVNLTCGCQFTGYYTYNKKVYDMLDDHNNITCYCESSEEINYCTIYYVQQ